MVVTLLQQNVIFTNIAVSTVVRRRRNIPQVDLHAQFSMSKPVALKLMTRHLTVSQFGVHH